MRNSFFTRNLILLVCFILVSGCAATKTTQPATAGPTPSASVSAETKTIAKPATTSPATKPVILYVISDRLNLRECPSLKCKVATVLKLGDEVTMLEQEEDWVKVRINATGREGWVASNLVGGTPKKKTPSRIKEEPAPRPKDKQGSTELQEEFAP